MDRVRSRLKALRPGQSLVEFTLLLPILLMMLSGLIEFGFMLNSYLDVIDASREAARFAANDDPTIGDPAAMTPSFWNRAWQSARGSLATASDGRINWNSTDPFDCTGVNGDIVVSAFPLLGNTVDPGGRYPLGYGDAGAANCAIFGTSTYTSKLTTLQVNDILSGSAIPNSGFVLVEIYYEYEWLLGLPWITPFFRDTEIPEAIQPDGIGDDDGKCELGEEASCQPPIVLYAYTIMPNTYVEPTPIP